MVINKSKEIKPGIYAYPTGNKNGIFSFIKKRIVTFKDGEICGVFDLKSLMLSSDSCDSDRFNKHLLKYLNDSSSEDTVMFVSLFDFVINNEEHLSLCYPISRKDDIAINRIKNEKLA